MSGLSLPYIMRFFGHAGSVEDAKKVEDKVIVVMYTSFRGSSIGQV